MGGLCFFGGERGPTCDTIHGIYPIFSTFISINICRFLYVFLLIEFKGNFILSVQKPVLLNIYVSKQDSAVSVKVPVLFNISISNQ